MELPPEAAIQSGRFTYAQARACGWTSRRLARAVRDGVLDHHGYGVYAVKTTFDDPVLKHAALVREAQLSSRKGWYAARRSSAYLMRLPLIGASPARPQLARDGGQVGAHGRDRHARITPLPPSDTWEYDGHDMCSPARTVIDIARAERFRNAVVVADGALRRGVDKADLHAVLNRMARWPGVSAARRVVQFADGRAESPAESLARVAGWREKLPLLEPQVEIYFEGRFLGRADFVIEEFLLAVETDGAIKFDGEGVLPLLIARQEEIRHAGLDVLRTNWDETFHDTAVFGDRVRRRLAERGRRALPPGLELRKTVTRPVGPFLGWPDDLAA
jgi:hypothetical protein